MSIKVRVRATSKSVVSDAGVPLHSRGTTRLFFQRKSYFFSFSDFFFLKRPNPEHCMAIEDGEVGKTRENMVGRETSGRRSSWIRPYYRFKIMLPGLSCLVACIGTAAALREARAGGSGIRTHQSSQEHFTYAEQPSKHTHTQFWGLTDKITAIGALRGGGGSSPASHFGKINQDYLIRSACAGVIASTALECVLYPLDTLKTRIQTRQVHSFPRSPLSLLVCFVCLFFRVPSAPSCLLLRN